MPDQTGFRFIYLDELYPLEVFKLLATAAEKHQGKYLEGVELIFPSDSIFGTLVSLRVPDPYTAAKPQAMEADRRRVFDELIAAYRKIKEGEPGQRAPAGQSMPLARGLCRLLLVPGKAQDKTSLIMEDEYLVVGREMNKETIERIFRELSVHATHTRMSGAETRLGSRYLFYVKDDHHRRSSFLSLAAGETFTGCQLLQGFRSGDFTVFLPEGAAPGAGELDYFCRLLVSAPGIFETGEIEKAGREKVKAGLLAAITRWPGGIEFLHLAGLRFYDQALFTRPAPEHVIFEFLDLKSGERSAETLKTKLRAAEPQVGYRLELRSTQHLDRDKVERLYEEKTRIEYQIAYRESISRPRPVLLRFTQKQLPALADVIRSFPLKVIHDGGLKYGFQATQYEPAGFHFILVDPWEAAEARLDPLPLWEDLDPWPMRFRLDPFWARYYYDQAGTAMVFVPEGTALFPPMHDWDRTSMDRYLRETMGNWFRGQEGIEEIPENPVYIFDGVPRPAAEIRISVLDQEHFEPLHTRLGWINDNLIVTKAIGIEKLVSNMARDVTWQELHRKIKADAGKIQRDFEETAAFAGQQMAAAIKELTGSLTEEVNRVVEKTFQMAGEVKKLDEQLRAWEEVAKGIKTILDEVEKQRSTAVRQTVKSQNEFYNMVRQIEFEIATSRRNRKEVEKKITIEIEKLKKSYQNLKEKLFSLKK